MLFHVGHDLAAIGQRAERRALRRRAAVPPDQRLRDQPVAVAFSRPAQRTQLRRHAVFGGGDIAERRQSRELRCRIAHGGGRGFRGTEQDLLAGGQDDIAGKTIDAGENR